MGKPLPFLVGDFETNNSQEAIDKGETFVWLWDICDKKLKHYNGTSISDFFTFLKTLKSSHRIYFHNLKFDGNFIISYLLTNNFLWLNDKLVSANTFSVLINFKKVFYAIKVKLLNIFGKLIEIEFADSSKKIPSTVEKIAESWGLPILKGEIDYRLNHVPGEEPSKNDLDYIHNDTEIIMRVLLILYEGGMDRLTASSDAFKIWKNTLPNGPKDYRKFFPDLGVKVDAYLRKSYRGGLCLVNKKYKGKILNNIVCYDENSMYPDKMRHRLMPYGHPIFYNGEYVEDDSYPLYIQRIKVCAKVKPKGVACILVHSLYFANEYLEDTNAEIIELTLTSIDLQLLLENYDIRYIEYLDGYKFKASDKFFVKFIDDCYEEKTNSTGAIKMRAKLKMNSLYGKFGSNPVHYAIQPTIEDGIVKYTLNAREENECEYVALSSFVTAYARLDIVYHIKENLLIFVYTDTDSIHTIGEAKGIPIDDKKLGYYKIERTFTKAKYLAQKTYFGITTDKEYKKICGASDKVKEFITFENFRFGANFGGKLVPRIVKGGVVLVETNFTIKERV